MQTIIVPVSEKNPAFSTITMATQNNSSNLDPETRIHRRVQQRIAGHYLHQIDPDGAIVGELYKDRLQEFKEVDPDLKKKFDKQHRKYERKESAYSIQNILWLIAAIGVLYYTNIYAAIRFDHRINRLWFNIGAALVSLNIAIGAFLIVWLSFIKKVKSDDWERLYPAAIPVATASFILGGIFLTIGLWPLWGPLTPLILITLFMGFVVTIAMLPNF